jgi:hypothetical protein
MTIWLWTIGITAAIWPIIVAIYVDYALTEHISRVANYSENRQIADLRENRIREEISQIHDFLEKQESFTTALWQKTFGFDREGTYESSKLRTYLGLKPEWHPFEREWAGPVVYLARYEPYPWGTRAENLDFPE